VETESGDLERAAFSLDELPPSDEEFGRWLTWLELAREELAAALDGAGEAAWDASLDRISGQDQRLAAALGADPGGAAGDGLDRLYAARDALTDALVAAGPSAEGVRRAVRLAIADDLRAADVLRGASA
jgi:hypothetical protein